jgi:hypothetical protein
MAACITLINKEHGDGARNASVRIAVPRDFTWTKAEMISLQVPHGDVAATAGISLGRATIERDGIWNRAWKSLRASRDRAQLEINVPAASAVVVRFVGELGFAMTSHEATRPAP